MKQIKVNRISFEMILLIALSAALIIAKAAGLISISWVLALAPIWVPMALVGLLLIVLCFVVFILIWARRW